MSNLSEQLAALGIRASNAVLVTASPSDQIEDIITAAFPWGTQSKDWHPTLVAEARDAHNTLEHWTLRLAHQLAAHGLKATTEFKAPQVASGHTFGGQPMTEECKHYLVTVNETIGVLLCRQCKLPVNPIWWVARNCQRLTRGEKALDSMRKEATAIREEIEALKKERAKAKQNAIRAREAAAKATIEADVPDLKKRRARKA